MATHQLIARFTVDGWEPASLPGVEGEWATGAVLPKTFTSGIVGSSVALFISTGVIEGNRAYMAVERITGTLDDGRRGAVTVHHGGLESDQATWFGHIVPGSGSDDFAHFAGSVRIQHDDSGAYFVIELAGASPLPGCLRILPKETCMPSIALIWPAARRTGHRLGLAIVLLLLAGSTSLAQIPAGHVPIVTPTVEPAPTPSASPNPNGATVDLALESVRPGLRDDVRAAMPPELPVYQIDARLISSSANVSAVRGTLTLSYTNTTDGSLVALPFRLYANGPAESVMAQGVQHVKVDGVEVRPTSSVGDSVLEVPFATPLASGATSTISMEFNANLPIDSADHFGIFGVNSKSGTWALAHWYPVIAGRDPASGWMLDPPSVNGDPIFSDIALFDVTVTSPGGWKVVTTGQGVTGAIPAGNDMESRRFVAGPVRDFTIVADADFKVVSQEVNGITFNSWYNPGEEAAAAAVMDYGEQSISLFSNLVSDYPYREIDFTPVDMKGAAGCEFPSLIYVGFDYYLDNRTPDSNVELEFTVAHEVVHQWFYGLVGNDQYAHAFIDEGLTNYLSGDVYFERSDNEAMATQMMDTYIEGPYRRALNNGIDPVVDQPTDGFESGYAYQIAAYQKAPLGFAAIRKEIGDKAFFSALQRYASEWSYRVAQPADLLAAFEETSGKDLDALWAHWFEEQHGPDDLG